MSLPAYDGDVLEEDGFDKPTLCIDFDGVLHDYHGSPDGAAPALDPDSEAIPGAIDWLYEVGRYFELVVLTSYATTDEARMEVATWLSLRGFFGVPYEVTNVKPPAVMYVDDRGYRFAGPGTFPTPDEIANSQPWWWMSPELPEVEGENPEQLAATVVARASAMEPPMTKTLSRIAKDAGGVLEGTDDRLKSAGSAETKIAQTDDPAAAAADLKDALRYSVVFPDASYLEGTTATLDALVAKGFAVERVRNFWAGHVETDRNGTYYGINAIVAAPNGYRFEVQFHTPESFRTNQAANWDLYRQTRDPQTSDLERGAILETMRRNLAGVDAPDGVEDWTYPAAEDDDLVAAAVAPLVAAGRKDPPPHVPAAHHNAVIQEAAGRIDQLEGKLAALLEPILAHAGDQAAKAFRAKATDHLNAAGSLDGLPAYLVAAGEPGVTSTSTMIAVKPRPEEADRLAADPELDAETLHVTLAYLGETDGDLEHVVELLRGVAAEVGPLSGEVAGGGFFGSRVAPGPTILLPDVPGLVETRVLVTEALAGAEVEYARNHGFEAHITIAYRAEPASTMPDGVEFGPATTPERSCGTCGYFDQSFAACRMFDAPVDAFDFCDEWTPTGPLDVAGTPLHFDALLVVRGDVVEAEIPLVGRPPLTAAGEPTPWTAPAGDEIIDVPSLVQRIRAKTDPVRDGFVEATMTPTLEAAGLTWDVTNPFARKVLAGAGSQVTEIAKTTQLNVMRIIRDSHANGLSIPQTSEAIQAGMKAAAPARAALIARTELAGAVNGGSLAAVQIVSDATGSDYEKTWLTAPGAAYPRHEEYDGLDGQTVPLDQPFEVGDSQLMFPGDPSGDPGEVCNCRCSMSYRDLSGDEQVVDADEGGGDLGFE